MIKDEELKNFFEFLISNRAANDFTNDLKDYVIDAKHNMQWRAQYMEWARQRVYDFNAGKEAKAIEDATNFLKENIPAETIARCVKLSLKQVLELQKQLAVKA